MKSVATGSPEPSIRRYAWHRVRRIMPAYVVTVLIAYAIYHFRHAGPNPGHTWFGLFRNLTLTQIYTFNYLRGYLHQGLTQMWSLAVEATFYVVLPLLAYLLLVVLCGRQWRPRLLLFGIATLALISPVWLVGVHLTTSIPNGARLWLPTYLIWFLAGMSLTVLQQMGVRCYALRRAAAGRGLLLHRLHADRRRSDDVAAGSVTGAVQGGVLRGHRRTRGGAAGPGQPGLVRPVSRDPADGVAGGDLLRDLPRPLDHHGVRDGLHHAGSRLHRFDARAFRGDDGGDHSAGLVTAPVHPGAGLTCSTGTTTGATNSAIIARSSASSRPGKISSDVMTRTSQRPRPATLAG